MNDKLADCWGYRPENLCQANSSTSGEASSLRPSGSTLQSGSELLPISQIERDELEALRLLRDTLGMNVAVTEFKVEILALQRGAGLTRPDLRTVNCEHCRAIGMNTGWGYWKFMCGAEILSDGEPSSENQCGRTEELPSGSDNASPATLRQPDTDNQPTDGGPNAS